MILVVKPLKFIKKYKMYDKLKKKLEMDEISNLNHRALRSKKHTKRIYNSLKSKRKEEIVRLGKFKVMERYDQDGPLHSIKNYFESYFLIDTNQGRIDEFTSTLAKLRLAYEELPLGFYERCGNFERIRLQFFSSYYALLDNGLGILKGDPSSTPNIKQFLSYEEMLEFGGNIKIYSREHFSETDSWETYGETATSLDKVINKVMHPGLAKVFDNVPKAVCGIDHPPYATPVTIDNKIPISSFPLVHPELLKVKPEYKEEFKKYKAQYDANCEAFRIHKL